MATGRITKQSVDALKAGAGPVFLWDDKLKGFGVKVTAGQARTYVYQFRMGGREARTQRYTIGAHGKLTADGARKVAEKLVRQISDGINPIAAKKELRREAVELAFRPYAARFLSSCKGAGWSELVERTIRLHLGPVLGNKALPAITRADVTAVFDRMPSEQQALRRNVFAVLRRLFRWAVGRGDLSRSPMDGMETPDPVKARDRVLTDDELLRVWNAAEAVHKGFRDIVRLLIITGQRREEVTGLDWSELNHDAALWALPGERSKNNEGHSVPLTALAIAIFDALARGAEWPNSGRVFATSTGNAYTAHAAGKRQLDAVLLKDGDDPLPGWRLHDLRRTLATGLQRLGVRFEVTEAVLNHLGGSRSGVAGVYQRHHWTDEKRAALEAWGRHVEGLLQPVENNVIPLAARRA